MNQSRDDYFETLYQELNEFIQAETEAGDQEAKEKILAMTYDKIKSMEESKSKLQTAYSEYTFFLDGYKNGSASISEVMAAHDEFIKLLNQ